MFVLDQRLISWNCDRLTFNYTFRKILKENILGITKPAIRFVKTTCKSLGDKINEFIEDWPVVEVSSAFLLRSIPRLETLCDLILKRLAPWICYGIWLESNVQRSSGIQFLSRNILNARLWLSLMFVSAPDFNTRHHANRFRWSGLCDVKAVLFTASMLILITR